MSHVNVQPNMSSRRATRGSARTTWLWLLAGLAALAAYLGSFTVRAGEVAVVARFGDPRRLVEEPGLHFKWPAPVDSVFRVDMRTNMLDPELEEFLTSDQKNVDVDAFVAWRVADPQQFLKSLRDRTGAEDKIGQVLKSTLVEVLNSGPFDDLVSLEENRERTLSDVREEITAAVAERCHQAGYGVEIEMAGIERINFPTDNRPAVEAAMRTTREKEAREIAAEGNEVANDILTKAKSEAATITTKAEADAALIVGSGIAEANRIETASRALNPELFDLVARHEVARLAFRGADLILGTDHWLLRTFDDPAKRTTSGSGISAAGAGEEGDQ
ncbi:MAG: protease modulator HflC [Planctomycetota bacterium]